MHRARIQCSPPTKHAQLKASEGRWVNSTEAFMCRRAARRIPTYATQFACGRPHSSRGESPSCPHSRSASSPLSQGADHVIHNHARSHSPPLLPCVSSLSEPEVCKTGEGRQRLKDRHAPASPGCPLTLPPAMSPFGLSLPLSRRRSC